MKKKFTYKRWGGHLHGHFPLNDGVHGKQGRKGGQKLTAEESARNQKQPRPREPHGR